MMKYAQWALEKDEKMAADVFTRRENPLPILSNKVLEFLSPFPLATVSYLEHIVHSETSKVYRNYDN